ncbi:MAG TPA: RNA polymerase sigma factor [Burkholderiaceae bacterium]|nr:RNA polymerase sigma factor [Burkholderiaceae bacterium]
MDPTHTGLETLDSPTTLELLARVAAGDESAFRRLYQALSRRIYAYALHRSGDPAVAEDIVVETMYPVWQRASQYRGDAKLSTWVLGIARHKLIDRWREPGQVHEDIGAFEDTLAGDAPDGFAALAEDQRRAGVRDCVDKLQGPQRECFYLVYYEDLSVAEVGAMQGVPANTVKTRLFHGRAKIKRCLSRLLERERSHAGT